MANNELSYGFTQWAELADELVTVIGERAVFDAITVSAQAHTNMVNALLANLVRRTTDHTLESFLGGSGTLEPMNESGNPSVVREGGSYVVSLPIQEAGTAWGTTRNSRALMTVAQANRFIVEAMRKDSNWIRRHVMASFLDNTSWSFVDDNKKIGTLTIEPLANSDVVFDIIGGGSESSQHYFATASAIDDDNNPYTTIYDQLKKHFGNVGNVIAFIPNGLKATTEALTDFIEVVNPNIQAGAMAEAIRAPTAPIKQFGDEVLGMVNNVWIVEWKQLPAGYIFAYDDGAPTVIGMREQKAASLQGFFQEAGESGGTLASTNMIREAGFGVMNRTGAVVYQIGNGSYQIPNSSSTPTSSINYDTPIAV